MNIAVRNELSELDEKWSQAIVSNDADRISPFMSEDWVLIGPRGNLIEKARFLEVVRNGSLMHSSMESEDFRVRVYTDSATVTTRTKASGKFMGEDFSQTSAHQASSPRSMGGGFAF